MTPQTASGAALTGNKFECYSYLQQEVEAAPNKSIPPDGASPEDGGGKGTVPKDAAGR